MTPRRPDRRHHLVLAAIVLCGATFRLWGIGWGLRDAAIQRRPHPDEWVVYWLFRWFHHSGTLNPCSKPLSTCFFDWGGFFPYLAYGMHSVLLPMLERIPAGNFGSHADLGFVLSVLSGRLTSALVSTITIVVVYAIARTTFSPQAGLLAALVMATSALPIQLAHFATPDSTVALLVSMALYCMTRSVNTQSAGALIFAGAFVGVAAGTEYHMVILCLPLMVSWLFLPRAPVRFAVASLCAAALGYLTFNAYDIVDWSSFLNAMHHTLLIRTVDSQAEYQGRFDTFGPDWLYIVRYPLGYGVGALFSIWLVIGVMRAIVRRAGPDIVLLCWVVSYGLVVSLSAAKFLRYSLPLMPALAVLAGAVGWDVLSSRRRLLKPLGAVALLAATVYSAVYDSAYSALFSLPDSRQVATQWLQQNVPRHSWLAFEQLPNGLINLPYFASEVGYHPCFTQFQPRFARGPIQYVLTDGYALDEHPRIPEEDVQNFRATLDNPSLFRVAERIHYEPNFFGITFPIDNSPHDWRYTSRDITVFQRVARPSPGPALCYQNVAQAVAALYPQQRKA